MSSVGVTNIYFVGQMVRLAVPVATPFKNSDGVTSDPTTVVCKYRKPDGAVTTVTTANLAHDGVGAYHLDVVLDQAGEWWYRFEGHGNLEAVAVSSLYVENTPL